MFRKLFSSTLTLTLLTTVALTGSACTGGQTATADQPTQLVELGVSDDAVQEILIATDLADATEVADFYVYTLDSSDPQFGFVSNECNHTPSELVETECGGCLCMADGMILCTDFTCGAIDHLTSPDASMEFEPEFDDLVNPSEPEGDHTNTLQPAPIPDPGDDFDQIAHPQDDTGTFIIDDLTPAPSSSTQGLAEAMYANSPKSCANGKEVGEEWVFETRRCLCMSDLNIACYIAPTPTPEPLPFG
jgi:hypothetical protein